MIDKLLKLVERYDILSEKMSNPDIISDMDQYNILMTLDEYLAFLEK